MHARTILLLFSSLSLLAAATAAPAHADQHSVHANGGVEILGGRDAFSAALRLHAGYGRSFGDGRIQPTLSVGGTLGYGSLSVTEPRALDGSVDLGFLEFGPEITLALRFANGGWADSRVFVSGAWTYVDVDDRLMLDPVGGVQGGQGKRLGIGASWLDRMLRIERRDRYTEVLLLVLPHQLEFTFERSAGSDRYGATLSWGI